MKLAVYSTKQYDKKYLQHVNEAYGFELEFSTFCCRKTAKTAHGCEGVCIFVNDDGSRPVLEELKNGGEVHRPALCGLQQCGPRRGKRAGSEGGARSGVLPGSGG